MKNVRPFREEPTLLNKSGVALAYLVLGWIVASTSPGGMGNLLSIFMILGILVWVFFIRRRNIKYFVRFHVVQATLLNISLAAALWLVVALLDLLNTVPGLNFLSNYVALGLFVPMSVGGVLHASVTEILVMSLAVVLLIYSVRGQYTELPWITDGVRSWL